MGRARSPYSAEANLFPNPLLGRISLRRGEPAPGNRVVTSGLEACLVGRGQASR